MSNHCPQTNPCSCITQNVIQVHPTPCPEEVTDCCLKACSAILECQDAVGPCGQSGSYDLTTLSHITTGCVGDIKYILEDKGDFFVDAQLTSDGVLTWVTGGPETVNKYGVICFRITCQSECEDCIHLNSVGTITIGVKDICQGVVCDSECEYCNPCTGTCVESNPNLSINLNSSTSNISING